MPRFAANISMLFTELPFMERFAAAAAAGFHAVEILFPYEYDRNETAAALARHKLQCVLINMPPGNWPAERGLACLPGREDEFRSGVALAIDYALALRVPRLHMMAGLLPARADAQADAGASAAAVSGAGARVAASVGGRADAGTARPARTEPKPDADPDSAACRRFYLDNLAYAANACAPHGIDVLIEPINTRDMPGYFLNYQDQAHALREECGAANVKVQMDFYHAQIMEGDLLRTFQRHQPHIGHIQVSSVPDRHEPDTGEINYPWLFAQLDALGYDGWIGCEYRPAGPTVDGLRWMDPYREG